MTMHGWECPVCREKMAEEMRQSGNKTTVWEWAAYIIVGLLVLAAIYADELGLREWLSAYV